MEKIIRQGAFVGIVADVMIPSPTLLACNVEHSTPRMRLNKILRFIFDVVMKMMMQK